MFAVADDPVNDSLNDMVVLLEREVARLRESLEFVRLSSRQDRQAAIRWHVQALDERHDLLEELRALIRQRDDDDRPSGNVTDIRA